MSSDTATETILKMVREAHDIVIIQADNPDADSLGSAVALDEILAKSGKSTHLYCAVDIPTYLHYIEGWSRVENSLPKQINLAIIVDASTNSLLEKIENDKNFTQYNTAKKIVLDHHVTTDNSIEADVIINQHNVSSTSELVYEISKQLDWEIPNQAGLSIISGIMGDTQGLTNSMATSRTYRVVAELIDMGCNRQLIEEKRRSYSKFHEKVYGFKAVLIERTELYHDNQIATVAVTQDEINEISPLYNPAALIQPDMLQIENVKISIVFKIYSDGRITGAIRANNNSPIAAKLAEILGGGGHDFASGFKVTDKRNFDEIKSICIESAIKLLGHED